MMTHFWTAVDTPQIKKWKSPKAYTTDDYLYIDCQLIFNVLRENAFNNYNGTCTQGPRKLKYNYQAEWKYFADNTSLHVYLWYIYININMIYK